MSDQSYWASEVGQKEIETLREDIRPVARAFAKGARVQTKFHHENNFAWRCEGVNSWYFACPTVSYRIHPDDVAKYTETSKPEEDLKSYTREWYKTKEGEEHMKTLHPQNRRLAEQFRDGAHFDYYGDRNTDALSFTDHFSRYTVIPSSDSKPCAPKLEWEQKGAVKVAVTDEYTFLIRYDAPTHYYDVLRLDGEGVEYGWKTTFEEAEQVCLAYLKPEEPIEPVVLFRNDFSIIAKLGKFEIVCRKGRKGKWCFHAYNHEDELFPHGPVGEDEDVLEEACKAVRTYL